MTLASISGMYKLWGSAPPCMRSREVLFTVSRDGYVSGASEALRAVRFGDAWALYELEDVAKRLSPSRIAAALLPIAAGA